MSTFLDDYDAAARRRNFRFLLIALTVALAVAFGLFFVATQPARSLMNSKRKLVTEFLEKYANDPASISIQDLRYSPPSNEDGHTVQYVFVTYRQRNKFGAMEYAEDLLKMTDGRYVESGPYERALLPTVQPGRWSTNPNGR